MRVLLINRNDFVDGGADTVFLNTVDMLRSQTEPGMTGSDIETFTRADIGVNEDINPRDLSLWRKIRLARKYLYNKEVAKALEKKVKECKPDVAHIHLVFGTLSLSVLRVLRRLGIPMVMTVHDYRLVCPANAMLDRHGNVCEKCEGRKYYKCLTNRCSEENLFFSGMIMLEAYIRKYLIRPIKLIDRFIFVSQFSMGKHIQFDDRFEKKSSHLYNMTGEKETPLVNKGDYFLYFGRLSVEKGLSTLMDAATVLGTRFSVLGSGPLEPVILEKSRISSSIEYAGFKSGTALEETIQNCSFVVVPSEWYENNPMTIVEAFSMGKPVIGANIGGIPELVNNETGFLFESGNVESLKQTLNKAQAISEEDYNKMSQACYEFYMKNFNKQKHIEQLLNIYRSAI